jgi:autophagy-related protein 9
MEKSFLNFKAAHPDWVPADPSGSLYLSRMSHLGTAFQGPSSFRKRPGGIGAGIESTMTGTVLLGEKKSELADRAQEYDRALLQSQNAAAARRRLHGGGSVVIGGAASGLGGNAGASSSMLQSGVAGLATAQTAVLGDSQGSISHPAQEKSTDIPEEDLGPDGVVGSDLGDSYVDGNAKRVKVYGPEEEEEEGMEDGGVLGLLAQIYGGKGQGPARVI